MIILQKVILYTPGPHGPTKFRWRRSKIKGNYDSDVTQAWIGQKLGWAQKMTHSFFPGGPNWRVVAPGVFWSIAWPENNANKVPWCFFRFWVPKHLLPPVKIRIFGQKQPNFAQNMLSLAHMTLRFIWCPFGWLVGGHGARAVSRKTPIYFM